MAAVSPKKVPRVKPKTYSTCLLYNTGEASAKLVGLSLANCNLSVLSAPKTTAQEDDVELTEVSVPTPEQLTVSDKMSCGYCDAVFAHRPEQKRHYRSDWHRYNLKLRLKGREKVTEEQFEDISGNISSLSGSDAESEAETDSDYQSKTGSGKKLPGSPRKLVNTGHSSTDSESESGYQSEDAARRLPKVYFRNEAGEMLSLYRCVLCHKKSQPAREEDMIAMATQVPDQMYWAVFMAAGGHFAGAVYNKNQMISHKTFHRYVVRAKRGTAQGSRDSQGNAPKSAGASLRRYCEAALTQEIQDLISSWSEYIQKCDRIFLRAPSFNRKIFFAGKNPPFLKDDLRIRLIPFPTRRPTFNEVRRVYETLASIECYGDESHIQDLVPISPPQIFNPETGSLTPRPEDQLSPRQRKLLNRKLGTSPLAADDIQAPVEQDQTNQDDKDENKLKTAVPDHVIKEENMSSSTSTASETELVETMETINLMELKEYSFTRKPKRKKKSAKKRKDSLKCQGEPESNAMEEEKYHLKNSLYTACKTGDKEALRNLLAVLAAPKVIQGQGHSVQGQHDLDSCQNKGQNDTCQNQNQTDLTELQGHDQDKQCQNEASQSQVQILQGQNQEKCQTVMNQYTYSDHRSEEEVNSVHGDSSEGQSIVGQYQSHDENLVMEARKDKVISKTSTKVSWTENVQNTMQESRIVITRQCADRPPTILSKGTDFTGRIDENESNRPVEADGTGIPTDAGHISNSTAEDSMTGLENSGGFKLDETTNSNECDRLRVENENCIPKKTSEQEDENSNCDAVFGTNSTEKNPEKLERPVDSGKVSLKLETCTQDADLKRVWPDFSPVVTTGMLSEPFGDNNTTLLHVAAKEGHGTVVNILMEAGANPAQRDKGGLTPYMVAKDKATRNEFRRFMARWPDRYDYDKAQIPGPLTDEMEAEKKKKEAERKKAQKKAKQEQNKVKKEMEAKQQTEEREKQRFLNLSDREKRALAAEKRLVSQVTGQGSTKPVLSRCFQCGTDMTGKVPFEYLENRFCTSKCLQTHRKSQAQKKS